MQVKHPWRIWGILIILIHQKLQQNTTNNKLWTQFIEYTVNQLLIFPIPFFSVDAKERLTGNDPEKELIENGFLDYQRP